MDETQKMLISLVEENTRYRMAFVNLASKMEKGLKADADFRLNQDDLSEIIEIAGVVGRKNKDGVVEYF